jgi:hypothetical protein
MHDQGRSGEGTLGELDARRRLSPVATPGDSPGEAVDQVLEIIP